MDIIACTDGSCTDGFFFDTAGLLGGPAYFSGSSYGDVATGEPYNSANWSLIPLNSTTTPEPNTIIGLALLGGGLLITKKVKRG